MENRKLSTLNEYQKITLDKFSRDGLKASDFDERNWFNDFYHYRAFLFMVEDKKFSFDQAFLALDKLNKDQVFGILHGLHHDEVVGLSKYHIDVFLKYGIPITDVKKLNKYQLRVFLALRKDGIQADEIHKQHWLNNSNHVESLFYLMRVQNKSFSEACDYLKDLSLKEAEAISYGVEKNQVKGLSEYSITQLIKIKIKNAKSLKDLGDLNEFQEAIVKRFFHFGLTSQLVRDQVKLTDPKSQQSFERLILKKGMSIKDVLTSIAGLNRFQLYGLSKGLDKEEVLELNRFHIEALIACKTIENGLSWKHFLDAQWFNSQEHVTALNSILLSKKFSVEEAMQELNGLTREQLVKVSLGKKREEVIGLNEFHFSALEKDTLVNKGLTANLLRNQDWFDSISHIAILEYLTDRGLSIEKAITEIKGLNDNQAWLTVICNLSHDTIIKLTPTQVSILRFRSKYGFHESVDELVEATWLTRPAQAELLKIVYKEIRDNVKALAIVKQATDANHVDEMLAEKKALKSETIIDKRFFPKGMPAKNPSFYTLNSSLPFFGNTADKDLTNKASPKREEVDQEQPSFFRYYCNVV